MHYRKHIFCCVNERVPDHPRSCCAVRGSVDLRGYMKARAKQLGIEDIRVNNAGCLERCELGPTMVIYPEGIWYRYTSAADVDEILESHILNDRPVQRLMLRDGQEFLDELPVKFLDLRVSQTRAINDEIMCIEFEAHGGQSLPEFRAGDYLTLLIDGDRMRRCYAIVNDPGERHRYVIYVARTERGRGGSDWIRTQLKAGDLIQARYPDNCFGLDESATQHVLVGEGIGIAPLMAMARQLRTSHADFQTHYFSDAPADDEMSNELNTICAARLSLHAIGTGLGQAGHPLASALQSHGEGQHLYICGSRKMITKVIECASAWPRESIHIQYLDAGSEVQAQPSHDFNVTLARRRKTLRVNADASILDALRKANHPVDYACEEGLCGACRVKVLSGDIEHRDSVLTESEKLRGDTLMTCVSRVAVGESRLVLDI